MGVIIRGSSSERRRANINMKAPPSPTTLLPRFQRSAPIDDEWVQFRIKGYITHRLLWFQLIVVCSVARTMTTITQVEERGERTFIMNQCVVARKGGSSGR